MISKSSYMAGLTCPRKLWQLLWDSDNRTKPDGMARLTMEMGTRFGELAHDLFPDASLIDVDVTNLQQAVDDTSWIIQSGANKILEAAFQFGRSRVLADIVERLEDGSWHLIEVKSSTAVKNEHIEDLAYQAYVMNQAGYPVTRCSVIHADKKGVWPDLNSFFKLVDVSDKVLLLVDRVEEKLEPMLALNEENPPSPESCYSKKCHTCEYKKTVCWKNVDDFTIYDVVHANKIPALRADNILYIKDIPGDFPLNATDRKNVDRLNNQEVDIDHRAIGRGLNQLEFPLYYLDFESIASAVPLFDGTHPWQKLAFQYSLHIDDGQKISHEEYLHPKATEPSEDLLKKLLNDIGPKGSIIVYHADMEKGVIRELAQRFPQYTDRLNQLIDRIWDLELIFKYHYRHWKFGTKSSIKKVLPILCPELSYTDLEITEGGEASNQWLEMIRCKSLKERQSIKDALEKYCYLDTLAMVRLVEEIRKNTGNSR